jgi:glycosyltransferase involved in cell wall biosynthesis
MLACRLLDVSEVNGTPVDLVIGLRFPAYLIPHSNKVLWILHQFRTAYELWDHQLGDLIYAANGAEVRDAIRQADRHFIGQARLVYANSANVAARLKYFCDIDAKPLYHPPPNAEEFHTAEAEDYFFFPSRLCLPKRQALVLEALAHCKKPVRIRFAGAADQPAYQNELKAAARKLRVQERVEWLGAIDESRKRELYAKALGVIYPPIDEDYGYVTLEAMLASKPLVVCTDSGGPLEFVRQEETGIIAEPDAGALAKALDRIWQDRTAAREWGRAGNKLYRDMNITWDNVVKKLLA